MFDMQACMHTRMQQYASSNRKIILKKLLLISEVDSEEVGFKFGFECVYGFLHVSGERVP